MASNLFLCLSLDSLRERVGWGWVVVFGCAAFWVLRADGGVSANICEMTLFYMQTKNQRQPPPTLIFCVVYSSPLTIAVKSLQSSTLKALISLTESLNQLIFDSLDIAL